MIRARNILIAFVLLCLVPEISAQTFDVVERRNPWNAGSNATGIRMDSLTISYAELYGRYTGGDFRDYYEADRSWSAGAVAKTIVHTAKYSMKGSFAFDHTSGSNMSGSMFINPGYYPIDVLEFTPGRKDLQTYSFTGGISGDVAPKWRIGAGIDFASANYAKRKDLRHGNYRLDLTVAPGVMFHSGRLAVGLNYVFGKNTETVKAEEIGTAATSYYAFLDKGLMQGAYEVWNGSGTHLAESGINGFPVREMIQGAALQAQWGAFYADAEYRYGKGSVGEKQTVWFTFPSHNISSHLACRFDRGAVSHFLRLGADWSYQANDESVLGKETSNGITITHVYGSNRIFERTLLAFNPEYELISPKWDVIAGFRVSSYERLSMQMYPYIFSQSALCGGVYASGTLHAGRFDIKAGAAFSAGRSDDKSRTEPVDTEYGDPPYFLEDYYNLQNEYMIAPRLTANAALRWNFFHGMYAEAGVEYVRGFNLQYIDGPDRWAATLRIGYTF